jgi:hypothetical protein
VTERPRSTIRRPNHQSALTGVLDERTVVRFADRSTVSDPAFAASLEAAQQLGFKVGGRQRAVKVASIRSASSWSWTVLEPVAGLPDSTRATWRRS